MENKTYIAIDLKSFYASVECVKRGYDPLTTNLVVADRSKTDKTICLAVSPSLKAYGISGRARLFEVVQRVREINIERLAKAPGRTFTGSSVFAPELAQHPELKVDYIAAPPQMANYMEWSARIYSVYLRYVAPEDIHVYSIDEVFMDVTHYLKTYELTAHELAMKMIHDVLELTGITATAGIGTNLFLCKVAMDIVAKHLPPDKDGVRIASLNEQSFRELLWEHTPITDFWRIGRGYARKLAGLSLYTMGDIAMYTTTQAGIDQLYRRFGINAELLIDHAWGQESCTMEAIKSYGAERKTLGSGQVLTCAYSADKAKLVTKEMADALSLDLTARHLVTDQLVLTVGYDRESLENPEIAAKYHGPVSADFYGRLVPAHAHGTVHLPKMTSSTIQITEAAARLYDRIIHPDLLIRRIYLVAGRVKPADSLPAENYEQLSLFVNYETLEKERKDEAARQKKETQRQAAVLAIQKKYGKNAILKGMNMEEGATMKARNGQIGGHRA
ncbi:MAG: DNA methylase [Lachnospiraceae bacterium]|nr:DNA methylase [Lachnospiraceae bacterium]